MATMWTARVQKKIRLMGAVIAVVGMSVVLPGLAGADERDFYSGLAYLRAGAQPQAMQHLTKYRDEQRNPEIRVTVERVLPLLVRPLSPDVREYIAATLEDTVRMRATVVPGEPGRVSYLSRMFPVFP